MSMDNNNPKPTDSNNEEERSDFIVNEVETSLIEELSRLSLSGEKLIRSNDIKGVAEYIKEKKCKNIIIMTGAGISVAAGIPDFRSPGTGLYDNLAKYDLPYPEAVFDIEYFVHKPEPFYHLVRELYPENIKPTYCHLFVRLLHDKGVLLRNYTQNIDSLELLAEIPDEKLVFAHGSFRDCHCIKCQKIHDSEWAKAIIFNDEIPRCTDCNSLVKPSIVFFGENLPRRFEELSKIDFPKCDLLIIIGTSLKVFPFAGLAFLPPYDCPRVLLNYTRAGKHILTDERRDIFIQGDCQDLIRELIKELGWEDEFNQLVKKHMQISTEPLKQKTVETESNELKNDDHKSGSSEKDESSTTDSEKTDEKDKKSPVNIEESEESKGPDSEESKDPTKQIPNTNGNETLDKDKENIEESTSVVSKETSDSKDTQNDESDEDTFSYFFKKMKHFFFGKM